MPPDSNGRPERDDAPGPLIASGRSADVYDRGDGTVVRRYRRDMPGIEQEADVMRWVAAHGIRVPEVHAVEGRDLVLERIDGPTMLSRLRRRPTNAPLYATRLASLQAQLAEVPAPDWMLPPGWTGTAIADSVVHLDLHPGNVLLSPSGPVLIDWTNAAAGPAGFDAATSYVVMASFRPSDLTARMVAGVLSGRFRRARGRRLVDAFIVAACDHRLADANTLPDERAAISEMRERVTSRRR